MQQISLFPDHAPRIQPGIALRALQARGILFGTSGYSYEDWIGPFYPRGLKKTRMLEYYQEFFPTVELNFTYYSLPRASTLYQMHNIAPDLLFSIKAHGSITHSQRAVLPEWQQFADAVGVLADLDRLSAILFQFPYRFKYGFAEIEYVERIADYFSAFPLVFEFRHASWMNEATRSLARRRGVRLCSVDGPRLPGLTHNALFPHPSTAYYRLHGRNTGTWFTGDNTTRYDYMYSSGELHEIAQNILLLASQSDRVLVYANNHPRAQAVETACALAEHLDHACALAAV